MPQMMCHDCKHATLATFSLTQPQAAFLWRAENPGGVKAVTTKLLLRGQRDPTMGSSPSTPGAGGHFRLSPARLASPVTPALGRAPQACVALQCSAETPEGSSGGRGIGNLQNQSCCHTSWSLGTAR